MLILCVRILRLMMSMLNLELHRGRTPWTALTDWDIGLTHDLPWRLYIRSHLGQVHVDLDNLIVWETKVSTGLGDIHFTCPIEAFEPIQLESSIGNIYVKTPPDVAVRITVEKRAFLNVEADGSIYDWDDNIYFTHPNAEPESVIYVQIRGNIWQCLSDVIATHHYDILTRYYHSRWLGV